MRPEHTRVRDTSGWRYSGGSSARAERTLAEIETGGYIHKFSNESYIADDAREKVYVVDKLSQETRSHF